MYNDIMQIISQVGFPIFVAVYMLITMRRTIEKNTEAITTLKEWLQRKQ